MPNSNIDSRLEDFALQHNIRTKGQLCVVLVVTRIAAGEAFPFDARQFVTAGSGQVKGLGKAAVQNILRDHGIHKTLAEEGGRTSRGSMGLMQTYLNFLNETLDDSSTLPDVEHFWIQRVRQFFDAKPFRLHLDRSKNLQSAFQDLIQQAELRQVASPGTTYVGALFQHLVGAKLKVILPDKHFDTYGYSVADSPKARQADFEVGDHAIHVTTFPTESLIRKCAENLRHNLRPIIITSSRGAVVADSMSHHLGIRDRIEVIELAQFLAANLLEWSRFDSGQQTDALRQLIAAYNDLVDAHETDPSLRITEA